MLLSMLKWHKTAIYTTANFITVPTGSNNASTIIITVILILNTMHFKYTVIV